MVRAVARTEGVVAWEHVTGAAVNNLSKDDGEERIPWNGRHVNCGQHVLVQAAVRFDASRAPRARV